ncbi:MAG: fructose-1,6-bisphosphatase [Chloroflexi bacterium]|nr:fructose-1,6-bisphosphatase [Chloroflexota bacterium]MYI03494.1 fructose-1,6-bisphosphatase [Chloroflexota bacterium]
MGTEPYSQSGGMVMSNAGSTLKTLADVVRETAPAEMVADGLLTVVGAIAAGATRVDGLTRRAALAGVLGDTGETNVQGEIVQVLDAAGTDAFVNSLRDCGAVAALACEELEEAVFVSDAADHPYLVLFDPVDGSSNIDVAVTIGSIFAIYRRTDDAAVTDASLLRPGREQCAAVYVVYGSSTVLVVATEGRVDGFTLDPASGEFLHSHDQIRIPAKCAAYSVNEGNQGNWHPEMQAAVAELRSDFGLRYVGSLVADFHRDLLKGGIFLYPGDVKSPAGKLRLGYEANPLCYVAEQAGGAGSTGNERILDVQPEILHQRTPLIVGNADVVQRVVARLAE